MSFKGDEGDALLNKIEKDAQQRARFIPLLGAGFSADAGIPTARELTIYLRYCIRSALDANWCPRYDPWPAVSVAYEDPLSDEDLDLQPTPELPQATCRLQYAASGTRGDWREMLRFLARLDKDKTGRVFLGVHSEGVVDSVFVHLTAECVPALPHMMLAHLTDGLRVSTILTTNFDGLVEASFAKMATSLRVFDVHLKAGLPSPLLVASSRAIVKLHGTRFGLRADESLDARPSASDELAFAGYLQVNHSPSVRLLVMGMSGYEPRTLYLLESAAERLKDSDVQVYWLCYRDDEVPIVRSLLSTVAASWKVEVVLCRDLGLFLLELYQRLVLSLPPADTAFPAFPYVAPFEYRTQDVYDPDRLDRCAKLMVKALGGERRLLAAGRPGRTGISTVASRAFYQFASEKHCLWFDLDNFRDPSHFYAVVVEAIALKVARRHTSTLLPVYDGERCALEIEGFVKESSREFLIFINGRDELGRQAVFDDSDKARWTLDDCKDLWDTAAALARLERVRVVVLWGKEGLPGPTFIKADYEDFDIGPIIRQQPSEVAEALVQYVRGELQATPDPTDADDVHPALRFVYSILLLRRPRYPAVLCSWALYKAPIPGRVDGKDNDRERRRHVRGYCEQLLGELNAVRNMPGGCFWIHSDGRGAAVERLRAEFPQEIERINAECHQGIADWYVKLFRASNDPAAALESIYHRLQCALTKSINPGTGERMAETAMVEALHTVELASHRIVAAGYYSHFAKLVNWLETRSDLPPWLRIRLAQLREEFARDVGRFDEVLPGFPLPTSNGAANEEVIISRPPSLAPPGSSHFKELDARHLHILALIGLRAYRQAAEQFDELFKSFELAVPVVDEAGECHLLPTTLRGMRRVIHEWSGRRWSEDARHLAIRTLRHYMFFLLLNAEIREAKQRSLFAATESIYVAASTMMRYCPDHAFLQRENARLRSNYGAALANLERFHEGHRRINEAWGYLATTTEGRRITLGGILDLRRAELYLSQTSRSLEERQPTTARAYFEDARTALERADNRWKGEPARVWWRAFRAELGLRQLETQAQHFANAGVAFEIRREAARELREGMRLVRLDRYRLARLVKHWLQVHASVREFDGNDGGDELREIQLRWRLVREERLRANVEESWVVDFIDGVSQQVEAVRVR